MTIPDASIETAKRSLCGFVVRARRVEEHTLARQKDFVLDVSEGELTATFTEGETEVVWRWKVPENEELLESATARVRPLVLQGEDINGLTASKALSTLLKAKGVLEAHPLTEHIDAVREGWKELQQKYRSPLSAFVVQVSNGETHLQTNYEELAWAWVYGDVVHAFHDRREATSAFGVRDRYLSGSILTCKIIVQTISTMNLIRELRRRGDLELPDEPFDEQVTIGKDPFSWTGTVHIAEHDESGPPPLPDSASASLGDRYREMTVEDARDLLNKVRGAGRTHSDDESGDYRQ